MKESINWTMTNGKTATVAVELITAEDIWADGDKITVSCCKINVTASVEGMGVVGTGRPQPLGNSTAAVAAVSKIGKLAITAENHDRIMAAIAKAESTPEWQSKIATAETNRRDNAQLNTTRKANGYCAKCGSYCHGDCQA